jgi:hypothetical protein
VLLAILEGYERSTQETYRFLRTPLQKRAMAELRLAKASPMIARKAIVRRILIEYLVDIIERKVI